MWLAPLRPRLTHDLPRSRLGGLGPGACPVGLRWQVLLLAPRFWCLGSERGPDQRTMGMERVSSLDRVKSRHMGCFRCLCNGSDFDFDCTQPRPNLPETESGEADWEFQK